MEFKKINLVLLISLFAGTPSSSSSTLVRNKRWGDKGDTGDGSSMFRGTAGVDYPDLKTIPTTSFTCEDKIYDGGLYADIEASCQVYHVCQEGRKSSFLCGKGTIFNQQILTCDYWYSAQCDNAENFYHLNSQIGNANHHGFGGSQKGSPYQPSGTGHGSGGTQPGSDFPAGLQPGSGHQTGLQPGSGHQTGLQPGSGHQTGSRRTQPGSGSLPGSRYPTGPHTGSQPRNGYPTGPHTRSQPGSGYPTGPHTGSQPGSGYPTGPHTGSQTGSGYPIGPQQETVGSQPGSGYPIGPQPETVGSQPGSGYQTSGSRPGISGPQPGSFQKGGYKYSSSSFQAGNGPSISGPQPSSPGSGHRSSTSQHSSSSSGTFRKTTTDQRSVPLPNRLPVGGGAGQNQVYPPNRAYDIQQNVQHTCECAQQSQNNPWSFPAGMASGNADK